MSENTPPKSPGKALVEWAKNLVLTEDKLTAFYGPQRGVRQAMAVFCIVTAFAWGPALQGFFGWTGSSIERINVLVGAVVVLVCPVWIVVTALEIGHRVRYGDYTWLEVLFVPFGVILQFAWYFVLGGVITVVVLTVALAILGQIATAHWVVFSCVSVAMFAPVLYYVGAPLAVGGLREWMIRSQAEKRWDTDLGPTLGVAQDGSVFQVEVVNDQQEGCMTPNQAGGSLSQQSAGSTSVNLNWLPPGVADVIRKLQETAAPSRKLQSILAPLWSRIEAEAARRNFEKITELLETVRQQIDAARNLRKSFGGIQRAEMEEELANVQVQVELAKLQKELASYRTQSPEDWATQVQAEKTAEKDAKILAIQKEIALAKEVSALRKEAMEIEDEEFRKKALARIEAIWEENVFSDKDDDKK